MILIYDILLHKDLMDELEKRYPELDDYLNISPSDNAPFEGNSVPINIPEANVYNHYWTRPWEERRKQEYDVLTPDTNPKDVLFILNNEYPSDILGSIYWLKHQNCDQNLSHYKVQLFNDNSYELYETMTVQEVYDKFVAQLKRNVFQPVKQPAKIDIAISIQTKNKQAGITPKEFEALCNIVKSNKVRLIQVSTRHNIGFGVTTINNIGQNILEDEIEYILQDEKPHYGSDKMYYHHEALDINLYLNSYK